MLAAGGALAADKKMAKPSISVNGYYEAVVGGILSEDQDMTDGDGMVTPNAKDTSALDTRTDAEIHFNGKATLNNGMKVHAHVELEAQNHHSHDSDNSSIASNGGDPIDEYFVSVSGTFGKIILGGTGGAPVKMLTGYNGSWATQVGELLSFNNNWVPSAAPGGQRFYNLQHSRLDTGDAEKMTYISPNFGGFQIGMTYSSNRANNDDNSRIDAQADRHDGLEGAVSNSGKFGDVGFGIGAGMSAYQGANDSMVAGEAIPHTHDDQTGEEVAGEAMMGANANATDTSGWIVAGRLDFGGGFRVSAAHKRVTDENDQNKSRLTDVGVRFVTGDNSFSLVGSHGEMEHNEAEHTALIGSYARALGPGVKLHLNLIWNQSQNDTATQENTGIAGVGGIMVRF